MILRRCVQAFLGLTLLTLLCAFVPQASALRQEHAAEPAQAAPPNQTLGGELEKEKREEIGEEEEHEDLKHSSMVGWLAKKTGLSLHQAHLLAVGFNFALIVFLIYWLTRKSVPAAMRARSESIQRALEEARAASSDANRRLVEIEARLQRLDSEISQMQAAAEKETETEAVRIKTAAEEDIRKVVAAAEQEIAAAAKQVRRELVAHTADLAVALARKQIHVDAATDQTLVRTFAGTLSGDKRKGGA